MIESEIKGHYCNRPVYQNALKYILRQFSFRIDSTFISLYIMFMNQKIDIDMSAYVGE